MPIIALNAWDSAMIKTNICPCDADILLSRGMNNKHNTYANYIVC